MTAEAYDALQQAGELCLLAIRAASEAERLSACKRVENAIAAAIAMQEQAILVRWLAADGRCIIVAAEVAPTLDMRVELKEDMAALGWEWYGPAGIYRKLAPIVAGRW